MITRITWIKERLIDRYPSIEKDHGADLNEDGIIKGNEVFDDLNDNGVFADEEDFKLYLEKNRDILAEKVPFFSWGIKFSTDNIIHQLLHMESQVVSADKVKTAYEKLTILLDAATNELKNNPKTTPEQKVLAIYDLIKVELGISYKRTTLLSEGLTEGTLDCDTSSLAVLAIGKEFNWPIYILEVPMHAFVKWRDEETTFVADQGRIIDIGHYCECFLDITSKTIANKIFMSELSEKQLLSDFYHLRALKKLELKDFEGAAKDIERARELTPENPMVYLVRSAIRLELNDYNGVIKDTNHSLELLTTTEKVNGKTVKIFGPTCSYSFLLRGKAKLKLGDYRNAKEDFDLAIETFSVHPMFLAICNDLGTSIVDRRKKSAAEAYGSRGMLNARTARYESAFSDFAEAIKLDPRGKFDKARYFLLPHEYSIIPGVSIGSDDSGLISYTAVDASWYLSGSDTNWFGPHAGTALFITKGDAALSFLVGPEMTLRSFNNGLSLKIHTDAGYNISQSDGKPRDNGFFMHSEARIALKASERVYIGLGFGLQTDFECLNLLLGPFANLVGF